MGAFHYNFALLNSYSGAHSVSYWPIRVSPPHKTVNEINDKIVMNNQGAIAISYAIHFLSNKTITEKTDVIS